MPRLRIASSTFSATSIASLGLAVAQDDRELVAAEPRDEVELADALPQQPADVGDELVADRVAEAVVDDLEAVEVEHQQRAASSLLARATPITRSSSASKRRRLCSPVSGS